MATNTDADKALAADKAADNTNEDIKSKGDDSDSNSDVDIEDLDIDDCECLSIWRELELEQDSMKEFLQKTLERRPTVARDIVSLIERANEEATREIHHLINDIGSRCQKYHCNVSCEDEDDCNHGCNTRHHHDLE